jgi:hypothetical protein
MGYHISAGDCSFLDESGSHWTVHRSIQLVHHEVFPPWAIV